MNYLIQTEKNDKYKNILIKKSNYYYKKYYNYFIYKIFLKKENNLYIYKYI